ncbi:MAG: hypothetical protein GQ535_15370 [Rhodobacteraceae bacterium]|nr:hypothetical protein [Paracoccaceae bacterium]
MTRIFALIIAVSSLFNAATAQTLNFAGSWAHNPDSCNVTNTDLIPMRISDTSILFYESRCELTNPVNIRDMNGQLFDFVCTGEGEEWGARGLLLLNADGTLTYSSSDQTIILQRCE